MRIKYYFMMLIIFSGWNFICKTHDAEIIIVPTIKECKNKADELFKRRKEYKDMLPLALKNIVIFNSIIFRINHCDNELRKLLNSVQIISMSLHSRIKNRFDVLQAEEPIVIMKIE